MAYLPKNIAREVDFPWAWSFLVSKTALFWIISIKKSVLEKINNKLHIAVSKDVGDKKNYFLLYLN